MKSPLERAARVIALDEYPGGPVDDVWENYVPTARAVFEAIRNVDAGSPAVLVAGKEALYSCSEDPELDDARKCFHAMIDAALKEG